MKSKKAVNLYRLRRGLMRVLFWPVVLLQEGPLKNRVRCFILKFQHSLPVEFVVNKGDTVVQIGTPWPRTLQRYVTAVGESGMVVVFEANSDNYKRLVRYADTNDLSNAIIINGAACNKSGIGELSISPHAGDHKISSEEVLMDNDLRHGNEEMSDSYTHLTLPTIYSV